MAPPKKNMPIIINQVANLKRLRHGPKEITRLLNSINPNDFNISYIVIFIVYFTNC